MKNKLLLLGALFMITGCDSMISTSGSSSSIGELHQINIIPNNHCDISLNKYEAVVSELINVTINNLERGYQIDRIEANGNIIDNYQFYMPNEDVDIEVFVSEYEDTFNIDITSSPYAIISTDKTNYAYGEVVNISYETRGTYILDAFYVNDEKITGSSFVMPDQNVVIRGEFIDAIPDTANQLSVYGGGILSKSYWYFNYLEEGIQIDIKVIDRILQGAEVKTDPGYRDNIEFILSYESNENGWDLTSHKVLISCDGGYYLQRAANAYSWSSSMVVPEEDFNFKATPKSIANKQGYDGYEVNVFINYALLDLDRDEAMNHLTICMAQRNTTNYNATDWATYSEHGCVWEKASTHPIILQSGELKAR